MYDNSFLYIDNNYFSFNGHFCEKDRKKIAGCLSKKSFAYRYLDKETKLSIILEAAVKTYNLNLDKTTTVQVIGRALRDLRDANNKEIKQFEKNFNYSQEIQQSIVLDEEIANDDQLSILKNYAFSICPFTYGKMEDYYIQGHEIERKDYHKVKALMKKICTYWSSFNED